MQPRFAGRLGVADAVTAANAALGFLAAVAATVDPGLAARALLLAAIADGLDGVLARRYGSTPVGGYLDSLADVASFAVAPALFVYGVASAKWELALALDALGWRAAVALLVPAAFVAVAVVRLALFTAYDLGDHRTQGVQTTLAATLLAAGYLAGVRSAAVLLGATAAFCYLMVAPIGYPTLEARDALAMGAVQALAVLVPTALGRLFPRTLLVVAVGYTTIGPLVYRQRRRRAESGPEAEEPDAAE